MAMIRKPHALFEDWGQPGLELPDLLGSQNLEGDAAPPAKIHCQPISLEGSLGGIDMELTDALNEPLRPCLGHERHEVRKKRPRESDKRIGAALHGVQSTGRHEPPEPGYRAR